MVTESYCPQCGIFIAASPVPQFLAIAERIHRCNKGQVIGEDSVRIPTSENIVSAWLSLIRSQESDLSEEKLHRIMTELRHRQAHLVQWLNSSKQNERVFQDHPVEAVRAAMPELDEDLLRDLELITRTFTRNVL